MADQIIHATAIIAQPGRKDGNTMSVSTTNHETIHRVKKTPWSDEMDGLKQFLIDNGHEIPADAVVHLVSVPKEQRGPDGLPLFRIAVQYAPDAPGDDDDRLSAELNAGIVRIPVVGTVDAETGDVSLLDRVQL